MNDKRQQRRFLKRYKVQVRANDRACRGVSRDFSLNGLSIKTFHAFIKNTLVDIVVYLPDSSKSQLKGRVVRASQLPFGNVTRSAERPPRKFIGIPTGTSRNWIGVSIIKKDPNYLHLIRSLLSDKTAYPGNIGSEAEFHEQLREKLEGKKPLAALGEFEAFARDMERKLNSV